ncbi:bile acid:sodium symporter family protein [Psychromonas sp. KJ10-2]|uniref:bile acid:sodium symporter family protein n=1 Tax=Psychromonas sp. KJ10-2 TaxID=3391822 RepID=UPI0039B51074
MTPVIAQTITQIMLPVVLGLVMLGMGLNLKIKDFKAVLNTPRVAIIGFLLQLCLLPILALLIIKAFSLDQAAAAGLFLLALCPGGATSNLFSFIAKGNLALSVCLTSIVSMLSPLILPLAFIGFIHYTGNADSKLFNLPLLPAIKQLTVVTLLPTVIGMCIGYFADQWSQSVIPLIKKISTISMLMIISALVLANLSIIPAMFSLQGVAVMALCSLALIIAYFITGKLNVNDTDRKTIAIEVGVQNAGTAMMIAFTIMHQPALMTIPLMYGLLMNIPAFLFVYWLLNKGKRQIAISGNVVP